MNARLFLESLYQAALEGCEPGGAVARALGRPGNARLLSAARGIGVFACGKAAAAMVRGVPKRLRKGALVVLPRGYPAAGLSGAEVLFAAHPEPDRSSLQAARRAVQFFEGFGNGDLILCLISGGTSSLLAMPLPGWTLEEKRRAVRRLVRSGASILAVNRLRRSLSAIKGGKLGRRTDARLVTLVLSDVPGDRPGMVGSGPTVRNRPGDVTLVVGSNALGLEAAARRARGLRCRATVERAWIRGEAREEGARFARAALRLAPGEVLLTGGETAVTLGRRRGRGGRSLEFALGAALVLDGSRGVSVLAAGSDGIDGGSRAAGAFSDGQSISRAKSLGLDPAAALARHDTEPFFDAVGGLLVTGPTGTNVCDWSFAVKQKPRVS